MRPQLPCAAHPALHLIEHQQGARLVAELSEAFQEGPGGCVDATLALHRLHKHCRSDSLADALRRRLQVAPLGLQQRRILANYPSQEALRL